MDTIDSLFFQFIIFSVAGWLLEVTYRAIENRRFINPGFNAGPWVPLYGSAAVILSVTVTSISGHPIYIRALFYLAVTTFLEYVTGEFLLLVFKKRYWDYSENFKNFRGLVCPGFSLAWVIAAFVYEFFLHPGAVYVTGLVPVQTIRVVNVSFITVLTVDFIYSSGLSRIIYTQVRIMGGKLEDSLSRYRVPAPAWAFIKKYDVLPKVKRENNFRLRNEAPRRRGKKKLGELIFEIQAYIQKGRRKK